jgi:hypothetical protein
VRSRKYPVFGAYTGQVHVIKKIPFSGRTLYSIEGLLEYRLSIIWFIGVMSFFFLLSFIAQLDLWFGAALQAIGTGLTIFFTYQLGKNEQEEVAERVEASFLRLRSTVQNIR